MSKLYKAKDFLKTEKIISFSPDDVLSKAVAALGSSHDAAFVLDEKGVLLGTVNPYYAQYHGRFPSETKLKRCMMMPPKLSLESGLVDILKNMLESKIYFLPVVESGGKLQGIVSFRSMLKILSKDTDLVSLLEDNLYKRNITTIDKNLSLSKTRTLLKKKNTSRLPVVDDNGKLIGLVTRFDLREVLSDPVSSQRSPRRGQNKKSLSYPIKGFMVKNVITAKENSSVANLIDKMRMNRVGSVILIDKDNKPKGVLAYRDIIKSLIKILKSKDLNFKIKTPKDFLYRENFEKLLREKVNKISKGMWISSVEGRLVAGKDSDLSDKWYEFSLTMSTDQMSYTAKQRALGWRKVIIETVKKLAAQLR